MKCSLRFDMPFSIFCIVATCSIQIAFADTDPDWYLKKASAAVSFFKREYQNVDQYEPKWTAYCGGEEADYKNGFNDGLKFAISRFPNMGTDRELRQVLKANQKKSNSYKTGFTVALEVYSAHQASVK